VNLDDKIIRKEFSALEIEALYASGVEDHDVEFFSHLLNRLKQELIGSITLSEDPTVSAKLVFKWLWDKKPNRYKQKGHFKLSEVVQRQLSEESQHVGNCQGLTVLYNCLMRKIGINVEALHLEHAFGIGPHVLSILIVGQTQIHIENILENGFDYKGHYNKSMITQYGDRELVADIYHSQGNEYFQNEAYDNALRCYNQAIYLNPQYEKARLNKAILMEKISKSFDE
jgi:tetratricopeptide (TPR) repeat protein